MTTRTPRTTAHTAAQLCRAMDLTPDQLARARAAGLIPGYDMKTPRWSGRLVDELVARRDDILRAIPDDLSQDQLMQELGLTYGQWRRAVDAGLIPGPDRGGEYWTRPLADTLIARAGRLREQAPAQPLGAGRCARLLSEAVGVEVEVTDFLQLVKAGHTEAVDHYKKWDLYDVDRLNALVATEAGRRLVIDTVIARRAWIEASITAEDAGRWLGWDVDQFVAECRALGVMPGRFDRYSRDDVQRISEDEELVERVCRERLLGPDQAAELLEVRRRDFDYVVAAGWVSPADHVDMEIGQRYKIVRVPLYRQGDVADVLQIPGVDWEEVRAARPGAPSPLREHARLPIARADAVRAFCRDVGAAWSVEVWPRYYGRDDVWHVDWEQRRDGHPTRAEVRAALLEHRGAARYAARVVLSTEVGEVINWARRMLEPGAAVIVDTETTDLDGVVVEIAVVDAADGRVLLDTLVHPGGELVAAGARQVHGITDEELAAAPHWREVVPRFLQAVGGRRVLAYNAAFDRRRIAATQERAGLDAAVLPGEERWECLMEARSVWERVGRRLRLGGGHRAAQDALAALEVLRAMVRPPSTTRTDK